MRGPRHCPVIGDRGVYTLYIYLLAKDGDIKVYNRRTITVTIATIKTSIL
jgi:hypothetical protein